MFPTTFEQRMKRLLGDEWEAFSATFTEPLTTRGLRANGLKITAENLKTLLPFSVTPTPFCTDGWVTDTPFRAGADPLHHAGAYYVQEPSAMSAVTVLAPRAGERILDLCAAPGGKSTQIAAALQGEGLLWCNEYVPARARALVQNLERCGVRNAVVSVGDTGRLPQTLADGFDGVLADVPCSGEGMFRKEAEALTHWSEDNVVLCAERGQEILHNAALCVRPGGRLVLSTCTFAPEENERAVVRFLQTHPEFTLTDCRVTFGRPGFDAERISPFLTIEEQAFARTVPLQYCRRIFPMDGGEGHFIARFVRAGDERVSLPSAPLPKETDGIKAAKTVYTECFTDLPRGRFVQMGDTVRLLPADLPATRGITLLCAGVVAAHLHTGRVLRAEPDHALFQSTPVSACRRVVDLPADGQEIFEFLKGLELSVTTPDGYTAVAVAGLVTGFGKTSHGRLKNHYPKGLRLLK